MRIAAGFLAFILLAACGDSSGLAPLPTDQIRARFPAGGVVEVIEVDAVDRLPLRSAELIAPDGEATAAASIAVNPAPGSTFSQQFPNGPYAGTAFGVSSIGAKALAPGVVGAAPETRTQLLATVSTASISLPDPVEYRRDWRNFRIRLRFGDPPSEVQTREIAAPEPMPAS